MLTFTQYLIIEGLPKSRSSAHKFLDRVARMKKFKGKEYSQARTKGPTIKTRNADSLDYWHVLSGVPGKYKKAGKEPSLEMVNLKDLHTMQGVATVSVIHQKIDKKGPGEHGPIEVIQHNGINHLRNGNHRVWAARLRGDKEHLAKVYKTHEVD